MRSAIRAAVAAGLLALASGARAGIPDGPVLPDPRLTPGAVMAVTVDEIAAPGYARRVRAVSKRVKQEVYREYGLSPVAGAYEIDHLVPLELGGSNSIRNLWPESRRTRPWNARVKDALENRLHRLVCSGKLPMAVAQREIAGNWIRAYQQYFHSTLPVTFRRGGRRCD